MLELVELRVELESSGAAKEFCWRILEDHDLVKISYGDRITQGLCLSICCNTFWG